MERARRHQRLLARFALGLLALVAELAGRSLAHRLDFGRHVETPYAGAQYYPELVAIVKVAVALMLARLAWRFAKARAVARGARRLLLAPWLHTAALPVFAVLSVVVAVVYRAVESWLSDYESYARETVARATRLSAAALSVPRTSLDELVAPRSLFGLAFEVRPPPAPA
jgi:hypothetical protein